MCQDSSRLLAKDASFHQSKSLSLLFPPISLRGWWVAPPGRLSCHPFLVITRRGKFYAICSLFVRQEGILGMSVQTILRYYLHRQSVYFTAKQRNLLFLPVVKPIIRTSLFSLRFFALSKWDSQRSSRRLGSGGSSSSSSSSRGPPLQSHASRQSHTRVSRTTTTAIAAIAAVTTQTSLSRAFCDRDCCCCCCC